MVIGAKGQNSVQPCEYHAALVRAIAKAKDKPKFLISGSAVGYYGPRGDEPLTENSPAGAGFLADVCREWEDEARQAQGHGVRVVLLRTGIVLGKGEGALAKMVKPFKLFAGGYLGSGKQWMPWGFMWRTKLD